MERNLGKRAVNTHKCLNRTWMPPNNGGKEITKKNNTLPDIIIILTNNIQFPCSFQEQASYFWVFGAARYRFAIIFGWRNKAQFWAACRIRGLILQRKEDEKNESNNMNEEMFNACVWKMYVRNEARWRGKTRMRKREQKWDARNK